MFLLLRLCFRMAERIDRDADFALHGIVVPPFEAVIDHPRRSPLDILKERLKSPHCVGNDWGFEQSARQLPLGKLWLQQRQHRRLLLGASSASQPGPLSFFSGRTITLEGAFR